MPSQETLSINVIEKDILTFRGRSYWEGLATGVGFLMIVILMRDSFFSIFGVQFDAFVQENYYLLLALAVGLMFSAVATNIFANRRFRKIKSDAIRNQASLD